MIPYEPARTSLRTKPCTSSTTSCGSSEHGIQETVTPCSSATTSRDSTNFDSTIGCTTTNDPRDTENARDTKDTQDPRDTQGSQGPRNTKNSKAWIKANRNRMIQATFVRGVRKAIKARKAKEKGIASDTVNSNPSAEFSSPTSAKTAKDSTYPTSADNSPKSFKSDSKVSGTPNTEKSNKSDQSTAPLVLLPLDHEKAKKWVDELHGSGEEDVDPPEESEENEYIGEAHKPDEKPDRSEYNGVANQPIEEEYIGKVESLIVSDCSNSDGGVELQVQGLIGQPHLGMHV